MDVTQKRRSRMHSKMKGNVGELKVAAALSKMGFHVFTELGDLSKIDLIAEKDGKLTKIQVKCAFKHLGTYRITAKKSGPNYQFRYTEKDADVFALYCFEDDRIVWITARVLCHPSCGNLAFRSEADVPKNNQVKKIRKIEDYEDFLACLDEFQSYAPVAQPGQELFGPNENVGGSNPSGRTTSTWSPQA